MTWADRALSALLGRVAATAAEVGERFPLHADDTGWTTTARGSWAGGYWAGLLALWAATDRRALPQARAVRARLAPWAHADTVCRGMIFHYGDTLARLGLAEPATTTAVAAHALADAFADDLDAVPWGTALGPPTPAVRPDGAVGVSALLAGIGRPALARRHLATHLRLGPQPWPRGTAWLLLGAVDHGLTWDAALLGDATTLARAVGTTVPTVTPTAAEVDTSAAAIAAVALLTLGTVDRSWRRAGTALLADTVRVGALAHGGIGRGCYDHERRLAPHHELVWGDYFAALGLGMVTGLVAGAD